MGSWPEYPQKTGVRGEARGEGQWEAPLLLRAGTPSGPTGRNNKRWDGEVLNSMGEDRTRAPQNKGRENRIVGLVAKPVDGGETGGQGARTEPDAASIWTCRPAEVGRCRGDRARRSQPLWAEGVPARRALRGWDGMGGGKGEASRKGALKKKREKENARYRRRCASEDRPRRASHRVNSQTNLICRMRLPASTGRG